MKVALGSLANVREVLELLEVIEHTNFETITDTWRERQSRAIDYHLGRTGRGADYVYYDPCRRQKIDELSACTLTDATGVVTDGLDCGWVHPKEDTERNSKR